MLTRRKFLATAACTVATARLHAQGQSKVRVALAIPSEATGPHMPVDFVGLSYEVQQLADPTFFSAQNSGLIREFKALSTTGVLRLGGNTSEFAYWKPAPDSPEPEHPQVREAEGEPKAHYYAVTVEAVRNLAEFLQAAGWTCLYGIGMGTNTPARAAEEAAFVSETLGNRLQYFQVGNEVDLFARHLRDPKIWSAKTYLEEWLTLARYCSSGACGQVRHARCYEQRVAADRDCRSVAFHPGSAPGDDPESSLLLWRTGDEPGRQLSEPAETGDDAKGGENGEYRSGGSQQDRCARTDDGRQHVLSRRQAGCLRRICRCALVS